MTTICFDFDGVLATYDGWKDGEIGEPIPAGVDLVKLCKTKGYVIVINTCRTHPTHGASNQREQFLAVKKWLYENKIPYDWIEIDGKPIADVYVDDRALYFNQSIGFHDQYAGDLFNRIIRRVEG